jgi:hypothetical protein
MWTANGVALSTADGDQAYPQIVSDGAGGAIAVWADVRGGEADLYAQRLGPTGLPQWTINGVALCIAPGRQFDPSIATNEAGGAVVAWSDERDGAQDIFVQRVSAAGTPEWNPNGVALSTATGAQDSPAIASDGSGGAIVAWRDARGVSPCVFAQRVSTSGVPQWAEDGVALTGGVIGQTGRPVIVADGVGGGIVAWWDTRNGVNADLYAQRMSGGGDPLWTAGGAAVCTAIHDQIEPAIVSDGEAGAILAWQDRRTGDDHAFYDIYAQRIERSGQLGNPEADITAVADVPGDQGGWVKVSWDASYLDADPFFGVLDYRVWRSVPEAGLTAGAMLARGVTRDPDEAASRGRFLICRFASTEYAWEQVASQPAATLARYSVTAPTTSDALPGSTPYTAFMIEARAGDSPSSARWFSDPDSGYSVDDQTPEIPPSLTVDGEGRVLSFDAPNPNPARSISVLRFTLTRVGRVRLTVSDAAGRRVRLVHDGVLPAGPHRVSYELQDAAGRALASGLYVIRLEAEGRALTKRLVAMR